MSDVNQDLSDQAAEANRTLEHLATITDPGEESWKARELDDKEQKLKEAATAVLINYFGRDIVKEALRPRKRRKIKREPALEPTKSIVCN